MIVEMLTGNECWQTVSDFAMLEIFIANEI
jgi:hypothetical protein